MKNTIGVLGGLGPATTAEFYLELVEATTITQRPDVCIWSLPMNIKKESEYIAFGQHTDYFLTLLKERAQRLEKAGSDHIVIPCNTVHEFHTQIANAVNVPVVNLIELVGQEIQNRKWKKVTLLATSRTLQTELYQRALTHRGIEICIPKVDEQKQLDKIIQGILVNEKKDDQQDFLGSVVKKTCTEHIVLGCTDLQLMFPPSESVVDSMETLVRFTAGLAGREVNHQIKKTQ